MAVASILFTFHASVDPDRRERVLLLLANLTRVTAVSARQRELADFMPYHIFTDVDGNELLAVMHGQRVTDHLW